MPCARNSSVIASCSGTELDEPIIQFLSVIKNAFANYRSDDLFVVVDDDVRNERDRERERV